MRIKDRPGPEDRVQGRRVFTAQRGGSKKHRSWLATAGKWTAVAAIWGLIGTAGLIAWYAADLPDVDQALSPTRKPAITVLARDGSTLATMGDFYGRPLTVAQLPPALPRAVLAVEDRRFYHHFGLDPLGLLRAVWVNLRAGAVVQGGSTISQQAAKNLFLTQERTLRRKVQELLLALWLEQRFSKDQILAIYLNRAYFGAGAFGVDAAARKFFGRPATQVTTYQAAMLAGLLKAPSRYNPLNSPEQAAARTQQVLNTMVDAGLLSEAQAAAAWNTRGDVIVRRANQPNARYFVDWVMALIPQFVSAPDQDLIIQTTLDARLQRIAETKVASMLDSSLAQKSGVGQAALVALSPDGAVRALVGGVDYRESSFNRATQAVRQAGSAFKPIVYAAGLESGLSPDSRMTDGPLDIDGWSPRNFTGRYLGDISLRTAVAKSINTVAVRVGEYAGERHVIDVARRLGISGTLSPTPSLALGVSEVTPLELTGAYAAIANGGTGVWPYAIESVQDGRGQLLYRRSGSGPGRVLSASVASEITDMLEDVVESGTGRAAQLGRPVAGKTGTSQSFRDAWFVGWTADLVTGVWMGNDDETPMKGVTGGGLPTKLWRSFMADAHVGRPVRPLPSLELPVAQSRPTLPVSAAVPEASADDESEPGSDLWNRLKRVFGG